MSTSQMTKDDYLAAVEANGNALAEAGRRGLDAPVGSCPGWDVATLIGHLGRVYRSVAAHVETRATEMIPRDAIEEPPEGEAVLEWFEAGHGRVLTALSEVGTDEPVWSWSADGTAGFYHRRMAHETTVHRWDGESAHGVPGPIDGDLAADGVSELYELIAPTALVGRGKTPPAGSLHLHRIDGEGEWLLRMDGDAIVVTNEHAKGDAAVRATGEALLLAAWGRLRLDETSAEVFGDRDIAEAWLGLSR